VMMSMTFGFVWAWRWHDSRIANVGRARSIMSFPVFCGLCCLRLPCGRNLVATSARRWRTQQPLQHLRAARRCH